MEEGRPSVSRDTQAILPARLQKLSDKLYQECPPVCIGSQGRPKKDMVVMMEDFSSLEPDMLVALYVDYIPARPQIGRLISKDEEGLTMTVHWYSSSWTGSCKPRYAGSGANRRPCTELLDLRMAIL